MIRLETLLTDLLNDPLAATLGRTLLHRRSLCAFHTIYLIFPSI